MPTKTAACPPTSASSSSATRSSAWSSPTRSSAATPTCPRATWPSCARPWSTCGRWLAWPGACGSATTCGSGGAKAAPGAGTSPPSPRAPWEPCAARPTSAGGRDKSSILADTLEAVIGAVYIERGLDEASALVHRLFDPVIARSARLGAGLDWKTSLQELTASGVLGVPEYHVEESGPDHQKSFRAVVRVGGHVYGSGEGRSKKEAEQQAAQAAWNAISTSESALAGNLRGATGPAPAGPDNGTPAPPRRAAPQAEARGRP